MSIPFPSRVTCTAWHGNREWSGSRFSVFKFLNKKKKKTKLNKTRRKKERKKSRNLPTKGNDFKDAPDFATFWEVNRKKKKKKKRGDAGSCAVIGRFL